MPSIVGPYLRPYGQQAYFSFVLYNRSGNDFDAGFRCAFGDVKLLRDEGNLDGAAIIPLDCFALNNGGYLQSLTEAEMSCARGALYFIDQQNPKRWIDTVIFFETYGHPLSQHPSLGSAVVAPV